MYKQPLLPNKFKKIGWVLLIAGLVAAIWVMTYSYVPQFLNVTVLALFNDETHNGIAGFIQNNVLDEVVGTLIIGGGMLVGFSEEKEEDEAIVQLRTSSLLLGMLVHFSVLLAAFIFLYDHAFLKFMMYNMFTGLLFFIARFNLILYTKLKKKSYHEKHYQSTESHS